MKVKNCPLACAGEASYDNLYLEGNRPLHKVECDVCGCNITGERFDVVDKWNDRPEPETVVDYAIEGEFEQLCETLEAENRFLKSQNL